MRAYLTPPLESGAVHFHRHWKGICDQHGPTDNNGLVRGSCTQGHAVSISMGIMDESYSLAL